jgi:cation transport ATPase
MDIEYTCPMHPQVRQMGPGHCPICGMALEPVVATAAAGESPELRDMTRRFWVGLVMSIPVVVLEMGGHLVDLHALVEPQTSNRLQLLFGTPVVLWAGWPFLVRAWASIRNRSLNMYTLIALGTGVAWLYSIVGTLAPSLFPAEFRTPGGGVPCRSTSRRRRSSPCWCYSVRCSNCGHAKRLPEPLRRANVRVVMLTGDGKTTAEAVARELGIDEVIADVLPQARRRWSSASRARGVSSRWPAMG